VAEDDSPAQTHIENNGTQTGIPYESVLVKLVKKIETEPFLFVIAVAVVLIGLTVIASGLGTSEFRLITLTIAALAVVSIIGYYFLEFRKRSDTRSSTPHPSEDELQQSKKVVFDEPPTPPIFEESRQFAKLLLFKDKKDFVIHPMENRIATGAIHLTDYQLAQCAMSPWDFDRVVLYLHEQYSSGPDFATRMHHIHQEIEKVKATNDARSLIPLHYAVRSSLKFIENRFHLSQEIKASLNDFKEILAYLEARPDLDKGNQIKNNFHKIIKLLQ
jgi:hypothetical protein